VGVGTLETRQVDSVRNCLSCLLDMVCSYPPAGLLMPAYAFHSPLDAGNPKLLTVGNVKGGLPGREALVASRVHVAMCFMACGSGNTVRVVAHWI
jgi:hypothetical protein